MGHVDRDSYMRARYGRDQRWVHRRELQLARELLAQVGPVQRALDAPCGHGRLTPLLRQLAGRAVVGVDLNRRRIRSAAAAEVDGPGAPLGLLEADLTAPLPFPPGSFEVVLCFRLLQHLRDAAAQRRLLAELAQATSRYLLVSYYAATGMHRLQRRLKTALRGGEQRPLAMVPAAQMRQVFAAAGLRVLQERSLLPGLHAQRIALLERTAPATARPAVASAGAAGRS